MVFLREIKTKSGVYLARVKSYRENGKTKQKIVEYLGKKVKGKAVRSVSVGDLQVVEVKESLACEVIHGLAEELGIVRLGDPYLLALVYSQVLDERRISQLENWLEHTDLPSVLGLNDFDGVKLFDALSNFSDVDFQEFERKIYDKLSKLEDDKKAVVIDVTDAYFEGKASSFNGVRHRGKDEKTRQLVKISLAVTFGQGFPIMHRVYDGNLPDKNIIQDMTVRLREQNLETIIMDRGTSSLENLKLLKKPNHKIITGLSKTKPLIDKFIIPVKKENIINLKHKIQLSQKSFVYAKPFKYLKGNLIVCHNPNTQFHLTNAAHQKEQEPLEHAGFSLIYHNTNLNYKQAVKQYYSKDTVEKAFKKIKGIINLQPPRVWTKNNLQNHIKTCYLTYAILTLFEHKTKKIMPTTEAIDTLKHGHTITIKDKKNKHEWKTQTKLKPNQKKILKALKKNNPKS